MNFGIEFYIVNQLYFSKVIRPVDFTNKYPNGQIIKRNYKIQKHSQRSDGQTVRTSPR